MAAAAFGSSSKGNAEDTPTKVTSKNGKEKLNGPIKLKKPPPKHIRPGNWRDGSVVDDDKKKGTDTPSTTNSVPASPGPVVNPLDEDARETFATGRPLEDSPDLQSCKHCKKSFLTTAIKAHLIQCLAAKKAKAQKKKEQKEARERERKGLGEAQKDGDGDTKMDDDDDDEDVAPDKKGPEGLKTAKKSAGKKVELDETKKGKKRKADGDAEKAPKPKKKKEEPKLKAPKPKGPVDVERQCGVMKDGQPCARSLTCKSHSMGAKRAVPGRSLPYDMLLTAYQKKNQAKQQKAAIDANAPLEDEEAANGPVDEDEELTAVVAGLSNWNPQPVVPPLVHMPIEKIYMRQRLYEQLHNATNGFTVNIFKCGDGAKNPNTDTTHVDGLTDADGEVDLGVGMANIAARRASGFNMQLPQRKISGPIRPVN